jgi:hypothetical protein
VDSDIGQNGQESESVKPLRKRRRLVNNRPRSASQRNMRQWYVEKFLQVVVAKGTSCKWSKRARYADLVVRGLLSRRETLMSGALGSSSTEAKRVRILSSSEAATWERRGWSAIF